MKQILNFAPLVALAAANSEFQLWKSLHQKSYANKAEENTRLSIFLKNKQQVIQHNERYDAGLETFYLGLNKFADLEYEEYLNFYTMPARDTSIPIVGRQFKCPENYNYTGNGVLPKNYDWRDPKLNDLNIVAVTEVKDQASCGSCWTFGAAAAMEGVLCMQGSYNCTTWPGLAEQNILDCASHNSTLGTYDNNGCGGGEQSNAMRWVYMAGGLSEEADYPYKAKEGSCKQPPFAASVSSDICGTTSYKGANAELMAWATIEQGPVTIGIDASGTAFQLYSGGVYSSTRCNGNRINHAVTVVGFGTDSANMPYWIVKNSWGPNWGLGGYINVQRGVDMCGVERDTQYALMK